MTIKLERGKGWEEVGEKKEFLDSRSSTLVAGIMASSFAALFGATMVSVFACAVLIRWSVVEPALVGWGGRGNAERK